MPNQVNPKPMKSSSQCLLGARLFARGINDSLTILKGVEAKVTTLKHPTTFEQVIVVDVRHQGLVTEHTMPAIYLDEHNDPYGLGNHIGFRMLRDLAEVAALKSKDAKPLEVSVSDAIKAFSKG